MAQPQTGQEEGKGPWPSHEPARKGEGQGTGMAQPQPGWEEGWGSGPVPQWAGAGGDGSVALTQLQGGKGAWLSFALPHGLRILTGGWVAILTATAPHSQINFTTHGESSGLDSKAGWATFV